MAVVDPETTEAAICGDMQSGHYYLQYLRYSLYGADLGLRISSILDQQRASPTLRTVMPAAWSSIAAGCQMKTFPIRTSLFRARPSQSQHHRGLWARSPRLATARCGLAALPPFSWWPHFVSGPSQHTHTTHTSNARDTSSQPAPTKKCSFHQHSIRRRIITTQPSPVPPYPHRNPHHHTAHSIESAILSFQQTHTRPHLQIPPTHKHHHASHR
jgi:hypothetical protein